MNARPLLARLARHLLRLAIGAHLRRALPNVYARLDSELPYWFRFGVNARQVEGVLAQATSDALGRSPAPYELALVRLLYDPVAAAAAITRLHTGS